MKNSIINFLAIVLFSFISTAATAQQFVTLTAGSVVSLTLNEELNTDDLQVGNAIDFMVRSNVTVNGKVVIAAGSIAEGWVKKVTNGCKGQCPTITITVENVQTVDGQRIYLRSIPRKVKANCCNDCGDKPSSVTVNIGANLSAKVLNNVNIEA